MPGNDHRRRFLFAMPLVWIFCILMQFQCGIITEKDEAVLERDIHRLINNHRQAVGLDLLQWNETIAAECRSHSYEMASGTIPFGHAGFEKRAENIGQVIPFTEARENVAYASSGWGMSSLALEVVDAWLAKEEHRIAIESECNLTGIGVSRKATEYYFTQIFIKSR